MATFLLVIPISKDERAMIPQLSWANLVWFWRAVPETEKEAESVMKLDWYLASSLTCLFLLLSPLQTSPSKHFVCSSQFQGLDLRESTLWWLFSPYSICASSKLYLFCLLILESNFCSRLSNRPYLKMEFTGRRRMRFVDVLFGV